MAEKHWLSNQGSLKEERRKKEVFVGRTASRLSRRKSLEAVRKRLGSEIERGLKEDYEIEFMKESLLNLYQGLLLLLKWQIGKDGIMNKELIKEKKLRSLI